MKLNLFHKLVSRDLAGGIVNGLTKGPAFVMLLALSFSLTGQAPFKRIKEGQGKGEVLFELGRPFESWAEGGSEYWSYADKEGRFCQIRFVDGGKKVDKEGLKCREAEPERKPAYESFGKNFNWQLREEQREQRLEVYCGKKPRPSPGCSIDRCVAGIWYQKCQ